MARLDASIDDKNRDPDPTTNGKFSGRFSSTSWRRRFLILKDIPVFLHGLPQLSITNILKREVVCFDCGLLVPELVPSVRGDADQDAGGVIQ
jgi:hypothetical protein